MAQDLKVGDIVRVVDSSYLHDKIYQIVPGLDTRSDGIRYYARDRGTNIAHYCFLPSEVEIIYRPQEKNQ